MHEYSEPALPLSREGFKHALGVGHGRARMHLESFGVQQFADDVLDAATVCKIYDPKVEGFPTSWFVDFCEQAKVADAVIHLEPGPTHWDRVWRCELLAELALRGHPSAREALYAGCERAEQRGVYGAAQIISLDGAAGLTFVANKMGSLAQTDPNFSVDDDSLWRYDVEHGDGAALKLLVPLAATNPAIQTYLDRISQTERASQIRYRSRGSAEQTLGVILNSKRSLYSLAAWARDADPSELEEILKLALSDAPSIVLENALRCLSGCKTLPLHLELLPLLENDNAVIRLLTAATLGHHSADALRAAGVALLGKDLAAALELLRKNALPSDVPAITGALQPFDELEYQHNVAYDVVQLLKDNDQVRAPELALYTYEHSPCQNCRLAAIKQLLAWEACPDWLMREAHFDASEDVRELVEVVSPRAR